MCDSTVALKGGEGAALPCFMYSPPPKYLWPTPWKISKQKWSTWKKLQHDTELGEEVVVVVVVVAFS